MAWCTWMLNTFSMRVKKIKTHMASFSSLTLTLLLPLMAMQHSKQAPLSLVKVNERSHSVELEWGLVCFINSPPVCHTQTTTINFSPFKQPQIPFLINRKLPLLTPTFQRIEYKNEASGASESKDGAVTGIFLYAINRHWHLLRQE